MDKATPSATVIRNIPKLTKSHGTFHWPELFQGPLCIENRVHAKIVIRSKIAIKVSVLGCFGLGGRRREFDTDSKRKGSVSSDNESSSSVERNGSNSPALTDEGIALM